MVGGFNVGPWDVQIGGWIENPVTLPAGRLLQALSKMEERVHPLSLCRGAWSMVVPWTGFPLAALLKWVQPTARGTFCQIHDVQP